jgi:hypothetical protein
MMVTTHFYLALTIRLCGVTPPLFKFFTTPLSMKDRDSFSFAWTTDNLHEIRGEHSGNYEDYRIRKRDDAWSDVSLPPFGVVYRRFRSLQPFRRSLQLFQRRLPA